jgi:hypothetical protein
VYDSVNPINEDAMHTAPNATEFAGTRIYRNGEMISYTGRIQIDAAVGTLGAVTWYEVQVVADSHRIGALLLTSKAPEAH